MRFGCCLDAVSLWIRIFLDALIHLQNDGTLKTPAESGQKATGYSKLLLSLFQMDRLSRIEQLIHTLESELSREHDPVDFEGASTSYNSMIKFNGIPILPPAVSYDTLSC